MKIFKIISCFVIAILVMNSCKKKNEVDYSSTKAPEISLILDEIKPDLNKADNIPLVCVIFSEAGLKSVKMKIVRQNVESDFKEVTSFYDVNQYSVKELPLWDENMSFFKIIATDRADRTVEKLIPISVIKYMAPPEITFEKPEIVIDENTGTIVIPRTKFSVKGASKLTKVEVNLYGKAGIISVPLSPAFAQGLTYDFDQEILYKDGDNALQVSATDEYGKIKIETLPIRYIAVPAPVITATGTTTLNPIIANSGTSRTLTFNVTSATGINSIRVYKVEKSVVTEIPAPVSKTYNAEKNVDFSAELPAFAATNNGIRIVAFDQLGRSTQVDIKTIIDLNYSASQRIGSQFYSKDADPAYPGIYNFFSVKDLKTYNLSQFYANKTNIDLYFYFFGGAVRIYTPITNRPGEAWSSDPANNVPLLETWTGRNNTKIKKYVPGSYSFNFDDVTSTDLKTPAIQNYLNTASTATDFAGLVAGESIFFQTSALSTAPSKIGMMKIESFTVDPTNNTKGFYIVSFKVIQ
ncbi:hypothetical protein [Pedobacter xixiisoli]|uniref:Uncharacterized protein n=1 Tax=Pedobacter xixiisoli TaxID=1476464 RepID=A0A285ZS83_9SPHI|nr:hypothetical protein [Pedobacter xixiisoli]SOD12520.1 hypothetical protein SAMN06297358_0711 [Pedobacter xixiisoli]